jgi:hypothetical protein
MVKESSTSEDRLAAFKAELTAKRRNTPWWVVADQVERALETADDYGPWSDETLQHAVEDATDRSWGVLTRYRSVLRRVRAAAAAKGMPAEALMSAGFNAMELAVRLYDRLPTQGFEALVGLKDGTASLAEIRAKLAAAPAGGADGVVVARSRLLRQRAREIKLVEAALSGSAERLFGKDPVVRRRPALLYFRRVGYEVAGEDGRIVCGLDALVPGPAQDRDALDSAMAPAVLLSSYFPKFYLVLSPGCHPQLADLVGEALDALHVHGIGVMQVTEGGAVFIPREPVGYPQPDRTAFYESLRRNLAVARG